MTFLVRFLRWRSPGLALLATLAVAGALLVAPTLNNLLTASTVTAAHEVSTLSTAPAPSAAVTTSGCLDSVPAPGTRLAQKICYSLFQPAGSSAVHTVPLIFHSHGWAGRRSTSASSFAAFLKAGFGVLSFDQRGFGESGGRTGVENPTLEGKDVELLVAMVSRLAWVTQDGPGDPRLGAVGGSLGGGYQFVGAFGEVTDSATRKPIFDALAPEITWWDLKASFAPAGVTRTAWLRSLLASGSRALPKDILDDMTAALDAGSWPTAPMPGAAKLDAFFTRNGPRWQVSQGRTLDIPVLFHQGATDTLFPLQQGLANFQQALTPSAKARSLFLGFNGGHVAPAVYPPALSSSGDPCSAAQGSENFLGVTIRFFQKALLGVDSGLTGYGLYHLATAGNTCTTTSSVHANTDFPLALPVATRGKPGGPIGTLIAAGPIRVAGTPTFTATLHTDGTNSRAFYALGVGTSPTDVKIVQNNVVPVNEPLPVAAGLRQVELPSVAVDVPAGMSLYLVATSSSDSFTAPTGSSPGTVVLTNVVLHLPVVPAAS